MENSFESTEWISSHIEAAAEDNESQLLQVGGTVIDRQTGRVSSAQGERWLRGKELDLLAHFYAHIGVTFTRPELLESVWNCCPNLLTRTVDQTVATLRKKIESEPDQPRFLQTVYGIGYRLIRES